MTKTLAQMTTEIREVNIAKGWRPAEGGPGGNTWGDYIALLHSEISEALEAYRDHRLADATIAHCAEESCERYGKFVTATTCARQEDGSSHPTVPGKPEGVGAELADVLIRLLDMCDVFGIKLREMDPADSDASGMESFGDYLAWLHYLTAMLQECDCELNESFSELLQAVYVVATRHDIDLDAEYERKIAFNRTRPYQHGGRTVADDKTPGAMPLTPAMIERFNALWMAIPTDPRDWWTGEEVDEFIQQWERLGLPKLVLEDATGERLTLWCSDMRTAAEMLGMQDSIVDAVEGFEVTKDAYSVSIVQADKEKETGNGKTQS